MRSTLPFTRLILPPVRRLLLCSTISHDSNDTRVSLKVSALTTFYIHYYCTARVVPFFRDLVSHSPDCDKHRYRVDLARVAQLAKDYDVGGDGSVQSL